MRAALVVSAHLDDAVLGCGQFIGGRPECTIATIFTGVPSTRTVLTSYDLACGWKTAEEAMDGRRQEDIEATSVLQAKPVHMGFVDSQYGFKLKQSDLVKQVEELIDRLDPEFVVGPLGLVHPDHVAVREAILEATSGDERPVWLYEDLPARIQHPESVPEALNALRAAGYETALGFIGTGPVATKLDALWCYRSQMTLPEFANRHELLVSERFHKISEVVTPEEQA